MLNSPEKSIDFNIKGSGFKLITTRFSKKTIILDLKKIYKKTGENYFLLTKNHYPEIQKQLKSGIKLLAILQDTIHFKISQLSSKKVPIKVNSNITYKKGFDLNTPIKVTPDSILLSGTSKNLNTINSIYTEKIDLINISESTTKELKLIIPQRIRVTNKKTSISLDVDKFTEGEIEIPINIKNPPKKESINIFPKTVMITYKVGLKNFNRINASSFDVFCDYKQTKKNNLSYLVPHLNVKTNLVSSVRMIPNKIDFLIYK
ncbi:CdaR family protein [Tenacibaculum sp. nBUS_03]|uniref:CdaR family protein n=1 Tax=Tenacibaculum sp. nBUS_03 TaxID=3395320 RepID=UPI003EC0F68C